MQNETYYLKKKPIKKRVKIEESICYLGLNYFFVSIIK